MDLYSGYINKLIDELSGLPGIGSKSAQRLAFHLIGLPEAKVNRIANAMIQARQNVRYCKECFTLTDNELCPICANAERDHSTIMVVENSRDLAAYEKTGKYKGVYHVLHVAISPMLGIGPNDIRLKELIPELLEMVDGNEIKFNPAYELAFLRPEEQAVLYDILQAEEVTPSLSQAQRLKRASQEGRLSEQDIAAIMREEKAQTRDTGKVTLPAKEIEQFFPKSYTPEQKKKVIVKLLASWARQRGEKER